MGSRRHAAEAFYELTEEAGGARQPEGPRCIRGGNGSWRAETQPQSSMPGRVNGIPSRCMAGTPKPIGHKEDLLSAHWRTVRLHGPGSSISERMACRSSVAETTGNNNARTQARRSRGRKRPCQRFLPATAGSRNHNHIAGTASINQRMLSSSSIPCFKGQLPPAVGQFNS